MDRKTPFIDIIRGLIPFFVTRQVFAGAGRVGIGTEGRTQGFQLSSAGGLLRGRGGPGDDAEAADHQHPRRAARRRRQVPATARDHRRREPGRALDLPEGGDDVAGAGDDRGAGAAARPGHRGARGGAAGDQPRPVADAPGAAARRPADDRARGAAALPGAGARSSWTSHGGESDEQTATSCAGGPRCSRTWRSTRCAAPTGWTGRPSCACWRATGRATGWTGATRGCTWSTCSTPTSGRTRGCTTGWWRVARCSGCSPTRR